MFHQHLKNSIIIAALAVSFAGSFVKTAPAQAQIAPALPAATELLPTDLATVKSYGQGPEKSAAEIVPVQDQTFNEALQMTTLAPPPNFWDYGSTIPLIAPVKAGDVLWVSLWARRVTTLKESGEAQIEVAFLQKVDGKEVRPLEKLLSFGPQWTQFTLPFAIKNDSDLGAARLGFRFGYGKQSVEVGGMRLLNYGPNVALTDLPRTQIRYDGWAADAPWRVAAAERIEKYRKGDLKIRVTDAKGKAVPDAQIAVRMKRHAFAWGTAVDERLILDTQNPDNERYRETIEKYFNKVVFENDLKWGRWIEPKYRQSVLDSLPWFKARNIVVRGHVMVWPSWEHLPSALFTDDVKKDPAAIKQIVDAHIVEQTGALNGRLAEWDVANETFKHHDLLNILGRDAMADWFRQAKAGAPQTRLFYNDYTMFQAGEGSDYFYNTVKELKDKGAPIEGIGEQGHFAGSPPGIPSVLATLDKFGALGLPIQISEFDIDTDDAGLQADYMRDFLTATFSNPNVMGVVQWGFWEKSHWLPRAALWDKNWNLRPHGQVFVDLTTKQWWTNADGKTGVTGDYATRGFYGDYELTVSRGDQTKIVEFTLSPQNGALTVALP